MTTTQDTRMMNLDPTIYNFLKSLEAQGSPPINTLSPSAARNVLLELQRSSTVTKLPASIQDHTIPGGPTGEVSLCIVRPQGASGTLPPIMYFHGGGWILGDKETHDRLIREIANGSQAAVVFVNYAPSPEAHYPVAIEQAYTATKWVAEQGNAIGLDASRLVVAGESVGGNMVAAVTLLARQRGGPKIDFQAMFYPVTDANFDTQSYRQYGDGGYWLSRDAMRWFWNSYAPASMRNEITVAPLKASLDQLKGLPPALVITDENDVLRDEGEAYAHKLMAAGILVTATRYLGTIHDFLLLNHIAETPATRAALTQANAAIRKVFAK